jgi:hypothetical protein
MRKIIFILIFLLSCTTLINHLNLQQYKWIHYSEKVLSDNVTAYLYNEITFNDGVLYVFFIHGYFVKGDIFVTETGEHKAPYKISNNKILINGGELIMHDDFSLTAGGKKFIRVNNEVELRPII